MCASARCVYVCVCVYVCSPFYLRVIVLDAIYRGSLAEHALHRCWEYLSIAAAAASICNSFEIVARYNARRTTTTSRHAHSSFSRACVMTDMSLGARSIAMQCNGNG